jgi:pyrimidine operon attenuation protein/uracil phosphoribosyltransferase
VKPGRFYEYPLSSCGFYSPFSKKLESGLLFCPFWNDKPNEGFMTNTSKIMDKEAVRRAVQRMAHEILEKNKGSQELCLVGIRTRGVVLAERLRLAIKNIENVDVPVGILDITLYRDDLTTVGIQPVVRQTQISFDIQDKKIVLVDDVLFTGRTIRAALNALSDFGRPSMIQLAVLIDRGHRELPIRADFVGKNIPTSRTQNVQVILQDTDQKEDQVLVEEKS